MTTSYTFTLGTGVFAITGYASGPAWGMPDYILHFFFF